MKTALIILGIVSIYALSIYLTLKLLKYLRLRDIKKAIDEMVESGEMSKESGDALKWFIDYKPGK